MTGKITAGRTHHATAPKPAAQPEEDAPELTSENGAPAPLPPSRPLRAPCTLYTAYPANAAAGGGGACVGWG